MTVRPLVPRTSSRALAVALVVGVASLVAVSTACASSSSYRRGGRVGGVFDGDDEDNGERGEAPVATGMAYGDGAGATAEVEMTKSAPRGFFGGGEKKVARHEAAPGAPPPPPPPPPAERDGDGVPDTVDKAPEPPPEEKAPVESSGPRLVIYKGNITVMVTAVDAAVEKLAARAKELTGYVESQSADAGSNSATVSVRIPAEKFYALVSELGTYGQVTQKNISAEDVTKKVFDVELRLDTAEKSRSRLQELLKQATKMEEILQIENEVRRLTDEIEGMKGELRFLKDQVSMSTLTVSFYSSAPPPTTTNTRTRSRFEWINQVGIENVLQSF